MHKNTRGFTLIELAVAMFIIVLMLGSILVPLTTQVEQRQISDSQRSLEEIKEAILGFAVANGYLPCPDITSGTNANDGAEDVTGTNCTASEGNMPWATLGVAGTDPWGNRFRYRVDTDFTNRGTLFGFSSSADLQVCTTATCSTTAPESTLTQAAPNGAPAVILSHGKNGLGAINANTNVSNPAPASTNEPENTNNDNRFVSRVPNAASVSEFDDIVIWLSRYTLLNRMVTAGKLP